MSDVKDILGLSRESAPSEVGASNARKDKVKELKERPKGMSREAFNLLHGSHHIQQGAIISDIVKKDDAKPAPSFTQVCAKLLPSCFRTRCHLHLRTETMAPVAALTLHELEHAHAPCW
jgi:hypothetical protein